MNNRKYSNENWHGFLDDCYIALDATNINSLKLVDVLKIIHDNIKFAMEQRSLYLPFLGIMINKNPEINNIWMDIFIKKNTQRCVPFNCCHPNQYKNNMPFTFYRQNFNIKKNSEVGKKFRLTSTSFTFQRISTKFSSRSDL